MKKKLADKDWYELTEHYSEFYENKYKPFMEDMKKYILGDINCHRPEFWDWYVNVYSLENIYPS